MLVPAQMFFGHRAPLALDVLRQLGHSVRSFGQPKPLVSLAIRRQCGLDNLSFKEVERDNRGQSVRHVRHEDEPGEVVQPRFVSSGDAGEVRPSGGFVHPARPEGEFVERGRVPFGDATEPGV